MNLKEFATAVEHAPATVRRMIKNGTISAQKRGRSWVIAPDQMERVNLANNPTERMQSLENQVINLIAQRHADAQVWQTMMRQIGQQNYRIEELERKIGAPRFTKQTLVKWLAAHGVHAPTAAKWSFLANDMDKETAMQLTRDHLAAIGERAGSNRLHVCDPPIEPHCRCRIVLKASDKPA